MTVAKTPENALRKTLARIAPGTELRTGLERILRGRTGGLTGAAALGRKADDVLGALAHDEHVVLGRADILGGAVAALERLDEVAEVEQGRAAVLLVEHGAHGQRDHRLAAARVEAGSSIL